MWLKKIASKSIALALAGTFAVTPLFNMVSAMEGVVDYKKMCIENYEEVIEFDGVIYKYQYSSDQNGNQITKIINTSTGKEDILTFMDNKVLLNNENFASIESTMDAPSTTEQRKMNEWVCTGTYHKTIKWASNGEGYLVLSVIAQAMSLSNALVKASVGIGIFNSIASYCNGGTLHYSTWYYASLASTTHRYDWSFKASSGKRWGTYHIQFNEY